MFQLTAEEVEIMVSQNAIPSKQYFGGYLVLARKLPFLPFDGKSGNDIIFCFSKY